MEKVIEIELEQNIYSRTGTKETTLFIKNKYEDTSFVVSCEDYIICIKNSTYSLEYSKTPSPAGVHNEQPNFYKFYIDSDLVENPKSLTQYDWQLLKIIHPEVKSFQWEIFQVMKDLVDNVTTEEYTLERIKSILQKENKIEF
ncbi:hypothetical protein HWC26_gp047 [Aeromonas phage 2L372X]|uniref:Uncharacterized protein n=1 Tax=Aeromonas phage 2L372X TaxID=2588515 RepID=A0A5B9N475_9CAUD|nr:hypothetical protein HWC26_gp047 [Aeromonas phage 2L372X]QEG08299.1 hypothetical protein [Aeromonas phage 2L372X]